MIQNATKRVMLVSQTRVLRSLFAKTKGLMFSKPLRDQGLIFRFNSLAIRQIHTFFVQEPIDVLYLDDSRKVVEIKRKLKPYRFYSPRHASQFIIEFPVSTLTAKNCSIGDHIQFAERDAITNK